MLSFVSDPQNVFFRCVEDSSEAIMICDAQGRLEYVNPAWSALYGYTHQEALGKTPALLHSGVQPPEFYKEMWARILDPTLGSWKGELINQARDGKWVPVLLTITPFRAQPGAAPSGYMGIAVDLTYKRELEAKVLHQDRLASIGVLASGLAHEIGTPLGVIRGRAELLGMQVQEDSAQKALQIITSEIDRISKLIHSLLRVSRSTPPAQLTRVSLPQIAQETLSLVDQKLRSAGIAVELRIPPETEVLGDFERLEQVLLNLLVNSIHAIQCAQTQRPQQAHVLTLETEHRAPGHVTLCVRDAGCGIAPKNLFKVFQPFFTTKDVGEGTGLGLTIVHQLVLEMSGRIWVQSELHRGTAFFIELPVPTETLSGNRPPPSRILAPFDKESGG